ncbi:MAG: hypothetical protein JJU02_04505 [Cryomorphaceae bacterium]|nr:hypothetical protein [Cryomorphaceae bacterium]
MKDFSRHISNGFFAVMPFVFIFVVLAVFDLIPVEFNDSKIYGLKAAFLIFTYLTFVGIFLGVISFFIDYIGERVRVFIFSFFKKPKK